MAQIANAVGLKFVYIDVVWPVLVNRWTAHPQNVIEANTIHPSIYRTHHALS